MHITVHRYNGKYKIKSVPQEKAVAIPGLKQLVFNMKHMGLFVFFLLAAILISSTSDAAPAPTLIEKITAKLAAKGLGAGLGLGLASFRPRPSVIAVPVVAQPVLHVPVRTRVVFG